MIKSMTGYAKLETTCDQYAIDVEIRALNSRNLDIFLRVPHRYIGLEEKIKRLTADRIDRGRIEMTLRIKDESEDACLFEANVQKAAAYQRAISELNDQLGLGTKITLEHLLHIDGLITPVEPVSDLEHLWPQLATVIDKTLDSLIEMRTVEGAHIAEDLLERTALLEKHIRFIGNKSGDLLKYYQERLKERIEKLTDGLIDLEPFRIAQEAAFLADRSDVSEELVRIESHLKQLHDLLHASTPAGRKINFIIQELNREFNTLGSKTGSTEVSHRVVELKSELEKMREQVQNIE